MKTRYSLLLTLLLLPFAAHSASFTRLSDINGLMAGDEVVITMKYAPSLEEDSVYYGLNGDNATNANPKADTMTVVNETIEDPAEAYVFKVDVESDGWTFTRVSDELMLYLNSSGIRVGTATNAKKAGYIWNIQYDYLYATVSSTAQYIGVHHRKSAADKYLKEFVNYAYSTGGSSGWKTIINGEVLAFFVHRMNKVTVATVEGGTIAANPEYAPTDALVEITLTPERGFEYVEGSLVYTYMDGENEVVVPIEDNQFKMPATPVTVTAEFEGHAPLHTLDFTNSENEWAFPTSNHGTENQTFYLMDGDSKKDSVLLTVVNSETGGFWWSSWGGGHLLFGKKGSSITLPEFKFNVSKIVVYGSGLASEKTVMNIFVGEEAVSTQTLGSVYENVYLIKREYRTAGNRYALTILNGENAQVTRIDVFGTVPGTPETPEVSVPAGLYKEAQSVELSCATEGAKIYYTLDGKRPSESSTLYTTAIPVTENLTIRAIAITNDGKSEIMTARYAIADVTAEGTTDSPYSVTDVIELNNPGWKAWVHGWIINGFDSNQKVRELSATATNAIAIADDKNETDKAKMTFVELPQGKIRTALNVASNPDNIGKEVWVFGVLSSYGGQPGVSKVSKYYLDKLPEPEVPTCVKEMSTDNYQLSTSKRLVNGQLLIERNGVWYTVTGAKVQ